MLKLDNSLLQELGLGAMPEDQKKAMLQHIYETLELRVGTQLANQMTDAQLEEFERFIDAGGDNNQAEALKWLETNLPNYKQVVNEVFEALKAEIRQMAPQIMAAQAQPVQPQQLPQQPQQQYYQQPPQPAYGYQQPQPYAQPPQPDQYGTPAYQQPQQMPPQPGQWQQPQPQQPQAPQQQPPYDQSQQQPPMAA